MEINKRKVYINIKRNNGKREVIKGMLSIRYTKWVNENKYKCDESKAYIVQPLRLIFRWSKW